MSKRLILLFVGLVMIVTGATTALAQSTPTTTRPPGAEAGTGTGTGTRLSVIASDGFIGKMGAIVRCNTGVSPAENLGALVTFLVCTLSRYATAIAVLIIMSAGVMYILSGSNPALAGTAKAMVITTLTGLVAMYSISLVLKILIDSGIVTKTS
jgi:hypothetical protein